MSPWRSRARTLFGCRRTSCSAAARASSFLPACSAVVIKARRRSGSLGRVATERLGYSPMLQGFGPLQTALAILAIGLIIAWHEFGHYIVARALGMRVLKYSIGFGPKLWGFRVGEID